MVFLANLFLRLSFGGLEFAFGSHFAGRVLLGEFGPFLGGFGEVIFSGSFFGTGGWGGWDGRVLSVGSDGFVCCERGALFRWGVGICGT